MEIDDLNRKLLEALEIIKEKERDLLLAAELGQTLMEANNQLTLEYENLKSRKNDDLDSVYIDLEKTHVDLIAKYDQVCRENQRLSEMEKSKSNRLSILEQELQKAQETTLLYTEQLQEAIAEKKRLALEKSELVKSVQEKSRSEQGFSAKNAQLIKEMSEIYATVESLQQEVLLKADRCEELSRENELLNQKCCEFEKSLSIQDSYRETCQEQSNTIVQLNLEIEQLKKLKAPDLIVDQNEEAFTGKSLLGEVEDEKLRILDEKQHLSELHEILIKQHQQSLGKQTKMRNHLNRLKQLTVTDSLREKNLILEQTLSQCEAEKKELQDHITLLENQQPTTTTVIGSGDKLSSTLAMQLSQLGADYKSLQEAHKTLRLVKQNETDRIFRLTQLLNQREDEIDKLTRELADTKFQLDELNSDQLNCAALASVSSLPNEAVISQKDIEEQDRTTEPSIPKDDIIEVVKTETQLTTNITQVDMSPTNPTLDLKQEAKEVLPDIMDENMNPNTSIATKKAENIDNTTILDKAENNRKEKVKRVVVDRTKVQECNQQ